MSSIQVRSIDNVEDEARWDRYVAEHSQSCAYHLIAWRQVIRKAFGHCSYYCMATGADGEVKGILPLVLLKSPLFGMFLVSLPYFNYGGVLADNLEVTQALLDAATKNAESIGVSHIELRHEQRLDLGWPKKDHKVSMRLDLPPRFEYLMRAFPSKLRAQIRRGEKDGMYVRTGGVELLDDFYKVFCRKMRDLGTPVYGKYFFKEILGTFSKDARLCCVYLRNQILAAGFLYGFRQTLEIPWAASDRRYARIAPNMMLYGSVLRYACEQGYKVFDFGRSSKGSGTYLFKMQWGAKPVELHWYYWLKHGGSLPELNPQNPKYALAIRIWQRLPVSITTFIGPRVAKYLP